MNLTELSGLQESDESVWGAAKVSFTIETRAEEDNELVEREYTFSHADQWDKWMFHKFQEKRTTDTPKISDRTWRQERSVIWDDADARTVEVPQEVTAELKELLGIDEMTLQTPGAMR